MAGEDVSEPSRAPDSSLEGWLDAKAEELGVSREELLAKLRNGDGPGGPDAPDGPEGADGPDGAGGKLTALRRELIERLAATQEEFEGELADLRSELGEVHAEVEAVERDVEGVGQDVNEVERDVEAVESEFDEKIEDVRERIIQVKREADAKAPAEHDHPDLRQRTESVADRADRLADELDDVAATVEDLDEQVDAGFENYEDVLEYLTDATDELESKLTTLAEVTVDLRDQTQALAARHASRAAADELAHLANRRGVEKAKCSHCGEAVHVGLLAEPKCPHCASTFNDVEPKQGFFGSAKLVVGDPPALEGERADWDVGSVFGSDVATEDLDDLLGEDDE